MGIVINTNIAALNAQRNLATNGLNFGSSVEKLSSGMRINKAADDAAGLTISQKLESQSRGLAQAARNAQDGISMIQTAEGGMNEIQSMLQRMRELTVQAQNQTLSTDDTTAIQSEVDQLSTEIDQIATTTKFNGISLLDGTGGTSGLMTLQVGADSGQQLSFTVASVQTTDLDISGIDVTSTTALDSIDAAIDTVSSARSDLGAYQNRLEHTISNLGIAAQNLQASQSSISDLDVAAEMVSLTRAQILNQSGTAVLAQANASPQSVLRLLG